MFLEFRVKNYKSIKDEIILSLVASKDKENLDNYTIETPINAFKHVNKCAALYGPNASGKSNVLNAISYMQNVVKESANLNPNQEFNVKNFKLNKEAASLPTEFELTFLLDDIRYQYGFAIDTKRIVEEWLLVYPKKQPQTWFNRTYNYEKEDYDYYFGPNFSGKKSQKELWQKSTKPNSLFLSTAIKLNSENLLNIFDWITEDIIFFGTNTHVSPDYTISQIHDEQTKLSIMQFLSDADVGISDIVLRKEKRLLKKIHFNNGDGEPKFESIESVEDEPNFIHKSSSVEASFSLDEESYGTQRLFALAGPIINILSKGKVLIFDELDNSLHTLIARKIVKLFQSNESNPNKSQLIFSTHDTELLNEGLLRRDQVWFIEKNLEHVSELYSLLEFKPRKGEALEKGYLIGRYGAIPMLANAFSPVKLHNG